MTKILTKRQQTQINEAKKRFNKLKELNPNITYKEYCSLVPKTYRYSYTQFTELK